MIFKETKQKKEKLKIPAYTKGKIREAGLLILDKEFNVEAWPQNNLAVRGRKFIGRKGVADVIGYSRENGRIVMCEIKTVNDTFSKEQIDLLTDLHKCGGFALVALQEGVKIVVKPFVQVKY